MGIEDTREFWPKWCSEMVSDGSGKAVPRRFGRRFASSPGWRRRSQRLLHWTREFLPTARESSGSRDPRPARSRVVGRGSAGERARLRHQVEFIRQLVRRGGSQPPVGRPRYRCLLPGSPCRFRLRLQFCNPAPHRLRHHEGARIGGASIAVQGPERQRSVAAIEVPVGPASSRGRALTSDNCDWIRSYANDPRDRARSQETEARGPAGPGGCCPVYVLSEAGLSATRGVGADLGRRPTLG